MQVTVCQIWVCCLHLCQRLQAAQNVGRNIFCANENPIKKNERKKTDAKCSRGSASDFGRCRARCATTPPLLCRKSVSENLSQFLPKLFFLGYTFTATTVPRYI